MSNILHFNFTLISLSLALTNYIGLVVGRLQEWLLSQDPKMELDVIIDEYLSQPSLMDAFSIVLLLYYVRLELLNLHLEI